ncbi:MAG: hypothetical protein AB1758_30370, partial [Candidatus Eremiobacterota bacterium]
MIRKACALALAVAGLSGAATAQPQSASPPGQDFPPPYRYSLPDYWLVLNAAPHYLEWVEGEDRALYLWSYLSWFDGSLTLRSPRGIYREPGLNLVAGTQQSLGLDTLLDQLPFDGGRADVDLLGLRLTAAAGTSSTDQLPRLVSGAPLERFDMQALGLAVPLSRGEA